MKNTLRISIIAAYLIYAMYPNEPLRWLISIACLLIILIVFREMKGFVKVLGMVFLITGTCLFTMSGASLLVMLGSFGEMLHILSLFALIPLIALPVQFGHYATRVQYWIRSKVSGSGVLYSITSSLSYVLSSFMNIATLPMVYHMIRPTLDTYPIAHKERFMSRSIIHGFAMPTMWTPVTPIVGIIVEMTGVSWSSILPIIVPFSLFGLCMDTVFGLFLARRRRKQSHLPRDWQRELSVTREEDEKDHHVTKERLRHPAQIFIAIIVFNLIIFILEKMTPFSFILIVSICIVPYAYIWSLLLGKGKAFLRKCKETIPNQLQKMNDQFFVFLSAGYMITAIQASGVGDRLNEVIRIFEQQIGSERFVMLIPLIPLFLAYVGLHPAVALALTAGSLNPASLGISPELTAVAMLIGASVSFMMGPFNATVGMMSNLVSESNYRVSRWNAPFTATYLASGMLLLLFL